MNGRHRGDGETYDDSFTWRILRLSEDSDILNSAGELILESTATPMPLIPDPYLRAKPAEANIPDANLRVKLEQALGKNADDPITDLELAGLSALYAAGAGISDLTGLEYCINLTGLILGGNQISDISPLANLTSLTQLWLKGKSIDGHY